MQCLKLQFSAATFRWWVQNYINSMKQWNGSVLPYNNPLGCGGKPAWLFLRITVFSGL